MRNIQVNDIVKVKGSKSSSLKFVTSINRSNDSFTWWNIEAFNPNPNRLLSDCFIYPHIVFSNGIRSLDFRESGETGISKITHIFEPGRDYIARYAHNSDVVHVSVHSGYDPRASRKMEVNDLPRFSQRGSWLKLVRDIIQTPEPERIKNIYVVIQHEDFEKPVEILKLFSDPRPFGKD